MAAKPHGGRDRAAWYKRRLAAPVLSCALVVSQATPLLAVGSRLVGFSSAREFLAGDAKGTAITADGRLTLASPLGPKRWPEDAADAVVFGAVSNGAGEVFIGTGGGLGRLFVSEPDGSISLLHTAPDPNITAIALAPDGSVVIGTSPNGSVYRIDKKEIERLRSGKKGESRVARVLDGGSAGAAPPGPARADDWGSPKEAAIWALAFGKDGALYVGTGNKGRIYKRAPGGALALFHEIDDVHIRSLAVAPDGKVWAGTSDGGLLVAIAPDGTARTIHDFPRPEVIGIAALPDGTVYAAATNAEAPAVTSASSDSKTTPPSPTTSPKDDTPKGSVSVSTGPARLGPAPRDTPKDRGAEIAIVHPDGFVEPGWAFPDEAIYSLRLEPKRGELVLATGPRGRVYTWKERHLRLDTQTEQQQVVAAPAVGDGFAAVTMSAPGVFRPTSDKAGAGTYTSQVKDAGRLSTFGRLRYDGTVPSGAGLAFAVRGGNSEKPDRTWTSWSPVEMGPQHEGLGKLPAARFFQWRVEMKPGTSGAAPVLERVEYSFTERNARPVLDNVGVLEPGAVYARSGASSSAVLSVTNPDENGIYAGLESPKESTSEGPGKKLYRKGYRTLTWKGADPNGDTLRYEVDGRLESETSWFPVRKDVDEPFLSFDTTALPDGRYRFRVTASDRPSNPDGQALTTTEESAIVLVDNTPPVLKIESQKIEGGDVVLRVRATDALSPVSKGEGAVSADRWRVLTSDDGMPDGLSETFVFRVPKPAGPAVLSVRVVDAAGNAAAIAASYPFEK